MHAGAARSFLKGCFNLYIPLALRHQRQDRMSRPVCGLIYTEILISCDAQRLLNNAHDPDLSQNCLDAFGVSFV